MTPQQYLPLIVFGWLAILLSYVLYIGLRAIPPKPVLVVPPRRTLRARRKVVGVPRLCGHHTGATLRPGMMAIIDSKRCEKCLKEGKITA